MADRDIGVLVAQLGARRHYLVPIALHRARMLDRFVTDYYSNSVSELIARALPFSVGSRARARRSTDLPARRVTSLPLLALTNKLGATLQKGSESRRWMSVGRRFAAQSANYLNETTTHAYAFTSAAKELFTRAKSRGLVCVLDHATAPRKIEMAMVAREHEKFPEWSQQLLGDDEISAYHARQMEEAALADVVICNSTFAKTMLVDEGVAPHKVAIVPLGIHLGADAANSRRFEDCKNLHVLYVGGDALRKGVPYLAEALKRLASLRVQTRFVGALGLSSFGVQQLREVGEVVGDVPREQMQRHFEWADVLILPSVSDTFGLVILEAMARGIPVIASTHTGGPDIISDGVDGFVVNARDSDAIADRIEALLSRPQLRFAMGEAAADTAARHSLDHYSSRLISAAGLRRHAPDIAFSS